MRQLTEAALLFKEDEERVSLQARQIMRRVLMKASEILQGMHEANAAEGRLVPLMAEQEAIEELFLAAAQKQLGRGE